MQLAVKVLVGDDQRLFERAPIDAGSTIRVDDQAMDGVVHDLSCAGCSLELASELALGEQVKVSMAGLPSINAEVRWRHGNRYGCVFNVPLAKIEWPALERNNVVEWPSARVNKRPASLEQVAALPHRFLAIAGLAGLSWLLIAAAALVLAG